jgi:hypothetical protein
VRGPVWNDPKVGVTGEPREPRVTSEPNYDTYLVGGKRRTFIRKGTTTGRFASSESNIEEVER